MFRSYSAGLPNNEGIASIFRPSPPFSLQIKPLAIRRPPSAVHRLPSTVRRPPSTVHRPPSTVHRPPSAPPAVCRLPSVLPARPDDEVTSVILISHQCESKLLSLSHLHPFRRPGNDDWLRKRATLGEQSTFLPTFTCGARLWIPIHFSETADG